MTRRNLLVAFALLGIAALAPARHARAQFIDPDSLFLAPSAVPYQDYSPVTFGIDPGASLVFTGAQAGGSLNSLRILPELIGNPGSVQGDYTDSDLAAVSLGNYGFYYALQPNTDYNATLISANQSTVTFNAAGTYFVRLNDSPGSTFCVQVGTGFMQDGAADPAGPARRGINVPSSNLVLVSDNDPTDNGPNGALAKAFTASSAVNPNTQRTTSLDDAVDKIKAAYTANGDKKITVTLIGHGRSGSIKIDNQRINNFGDGTQTPQQFQEAIDPYVSAIDFYSCSTAAGPAGNTFLGTFADSIGQARGFDGPIMPVVDGRRSGFSANANVRLITITAPEPGTFGLLAVGFAAAPVWMVARSRRRRVVR